MYDGAPIPTSSVSMGGRTFTPADRGKAIKLMLGTPTRVVYRFEGVEDRGKLQSLHLFVCCDGLLDFKLEPER